MTWLSSVRTALAALNCIAIRSRITSIYTVTLHSSSVPLKLARKRLLASELPKAVFTDTNIASIVMCQYQRYHWRQACSFGGLTNMPSLTSVQSHQSKECEKAQKACIFCHDAVPIAKMDSHLANDCLENEVPCPGSGLGCKYRNIRAHVLEHGEACPMAVMAPCIEKKLAQQERKIVEQDQVIARQATQLAGVEDIQRRLGLLQGGLDHMHQSFYHEDGTPRSLTSPPPQSPAEPRAADPELEEHLTRQDEINGMHFSRMEELDARMQMLFTNETIRWQQEMIALGSAVTAMRAQMNTLTNAYLRQPSHGTFGAAAAAVASAGSYSGSSSMGRGEQNNSMWSRRGSADREDPKL